MNLNRRELISHVTLGGLAGATLMSTRHHPADAAIPKPDNRPVPRVHTTSSLHPVEHEKSVVHHLHKHHKYRHHHRHPHHKAHSLRARHTLNTPGNRHDLALVMWGEARSYGVLGMRCIGHVVMNRVLADEHALGHGIHGVCHKHKQFSCFNPSDPNHKRMGELPYLDESSPDWIAWVQADDLAGKILAGVDKDNTAGSTYYFAADIVTPYWLKDMVIVGVQFGHTFCKKKHHVSHSHRGVKSHARLHHEKRSH